MSAPGPVGSQIARLFPNAEAGTRQRLEGAARERSFGRRDILRSRGVPVGKRDYEGRLRTR